MLEFMEQLALDAGKIIRQDYFKTDTKLEYKGDIDIVTDTDLKCEEVIVSNIRKRYPYDCIITEEQEIINTESKRKWIVDPLDGTTNFSHRFPFCAVSIGLEIDGIIKYGVVYTPIMNELFSAKKYNGAFLNGTRICVSKTDKISNCLVATGFPYDRFTNEDNNLDNFNRLATKIRGIRRLGSAALDLCYVAANRVNGYWEIRMETWDLAAGMLIAQEAGAKVTKRDGSLDMLNPPINVIAANPLLHQKFLENIV